MPVTPRIPKKFRDWANKWATRFGLDRTWDLHYQVQKLTKQDDEREGEAVVGNTIWAQGYQNGTIYLSPWLITTRDLPDASKEHALIHEHLHLLFAQLSDAVEMNGSNKAYKAYCHEEELLLEKLASLFQRAYSRKTRVI